MYTIPEDDDVTILSSSPSQRRARGGIVAPDVSHLMFDSSHHNNALQNTSVVSILSALHNNNNNSSDGGLGEAIAASTNNSVARGSVSPIRTGNAIIVPTKIESSSVAVRSPPRTPPPSSIPLRSRTTSPLLADRNDDGAGRKRGAASPSPPRIPPHASARVPSPTQRAAALSPPSPMRTPADRPPPITNTSHAAITATSSGNSNDKNTILSSNSSPTKRLVVPPSLLKRVVPSPLRRGSSPSIPMRAPPPSIPVRAASPLQSNNTNTNTNASNRMINESTLSNPRSVVITAAQRQSSPPRLRGGIDNMNSNSRAVVPTPNGRAASPYNPGPTDTSGVSLNRFTPNLGVEVYYDTDNKKDDDSGSGAGSSNNNKMNPFFNGTVKQQYDAKAYEEARRSRAAAAALPPPPQGVTVSRSERIEGNNRIKTVSHTVNTSKPAISCGAGGGVKEEGGRHRNANKSEAERLIEEEKKKNSDAKRGFFDILLNPSNNTSAANGNRAAVRGGGEEQEERAVRITTTSTKTSGGKHSSLDGFRNDVRRPNGLLESITESKTVSTRNFEQQPSLMRGIREEGEAVPPSPIRGVTSNTSMTSMTQISSASNPSPPPYVPSGAAPPPIPFSAPSSPPRPSSPVAYAYTFRDSDGNENIRIVPPPPPPPPPRRNTPSRRNRIEAQTLLTTTTTQETSSNREIGSDNSNTNTDTNNVSTAVADGSSQTIRRVVATPAAQKANGIRDATVTTTASSTSSSILASPLRRTPSPSCYLSAREMGMNIALTTATTSRSSVIGGGVGGEAPMPAGVGRGYGESAIAISDEGSSGDAAPAIVSTFYRSQITRIDHLLMNQKLSQRELKVGGGGGGVKDNDDNYEGVRATFQLTLTSEEDDGTHPQQQQQYKLTRNNAVPSATTTKALTLIHSHPKSVAGDPLSCVACAVRAEQLAVREKEMKLLAAEKEKERLFHLTSFSQQQRQHEAAYASTALLVKEREEETALARRLSKRVRDQDIELEKQRLLKAHAMQCAREEAEEGEEALLDRREAMPNEAVERSASLQKQQQQKTQEHSSGDIKPENDGGGGGDDLDDDGSSSPIERLRRQIAMSYEKETPEDRQDINQSSDIEIRRLEELDEELRALLRIKALSKQVDAGRASLLLLKQQEEASRYINKNSVNVNDASVLPSSNAASNDSTLNALAVLQRQREQQYHPTSSASASASFASNTNTSVATSAAASSQAMDNGINRSAAYVDEYVDRDDRIMMAARRQQTTTTTTSASPPALTLSSAWEKERLERKRQALLAGYGGDASSLVEPATTPKPIGVPPVEDPKTNRSAAYSFTPFANNRSLNGDLIIASHPTVVVATPTHGAAEEEAVPITMTPSRSLALGRSPLPLHHHQMAAATQTLSNSNRMVVMNASPMRYADPNINTVGLAMTPTTNTLATTRSTTINASPHFTLSDFDRRQAQISENKAIIHARRLRLEGIL